MIPITFSERVLQIALSVGVGQIITYGDIARAAGGSGQAARSISGILGRYYKKGYKQIPFHRIVYSGGKIWSSPVHDEERYKLYKLENIQVDERGFIVNFEDHRKIF